MAQQKTMAKCPECGVKVSKDRLRGHIERIHKKSEQPTKDEKRTARLVAKPKSKVSPLPAILISLAMAFSSLGAYWFLTQHPNVAPSDPTVTFTPSNPKVGDTVTFRVESNDPDGDTLSFTWQFGDGSTGTGKNPTHVYGSDGAFTATVKVDDGQSHAKSTSVTVTVEKTTGPPPTNPKAIINTNYGSFTLELYEDRAPRTAGNFIGLANRGFYNGLTFHRVVANFVIQGGDPNGDGSGGSGETVAWENTGLQNKKYTVAMARSGDPNSPQGANTATSQFFVNLVDNPSLDGYTYPFVVFGKVIQGMSVVDAIGQVQVDSNDKPLSPVIMNSVTIVS